MGDRWTDIRELARSKHPTVVADLRRGLAEAGPLLFFLEDEVAAAGIVGFRDSLDAAVVALLQACALLERRDLPHRAARSGAACIDDPRDMGPQAIGVMTTNIERLFAEIARRAQPGLDESLSLTDSIKALRARTLLPLQPDELETWDADRAAVDAEVDRRRRAGLLRGGAAGKVVAALWAQRATALFTQQAVDRSMPRYLALMELTTLRNASAHGQTQNMAGLDVPVALWRRLLGFATLVCLRAFAAGVLAPAPHPEAGASSISAAPLQEEPEPLVAHAQILSTELLIAEGAAAAARRVARQGANPNPNVAPPEASPHEGTWPEEWDDDPSSDEGAADVSEAPRPDPAARRGRPRWFAITTAATVAVVLGTVLATVLAPQSVRSSGPPSGTSMGGTSAGSTGGAGAGRSGRADGGAAGAAAAGSPMLAGAASPRAATSGEGQGSRDRTTLACEAVRAQPPAGVHPMLRVQSARGIAAGSLVSVGELSELVRDWEQDSLGPVVVIETSEQFARAALGRAVRGAACETRQVLSADEALAPGTLTDAALVVVDIDSADDPRLTRLGAQARSGPGLRLVAFVPSGAIPASFAATILAPAEFDCVGAIMELRSAVAARISPAGIAQTELHERMAAWQLLPRSPEESGVESSASRCRPAPALRDARGLTVVATVLARHHAPPLGFTGAWVDWIDGMGGASGASDPVSNLLDGERTLVARARELASAAAAELGGAGTRRGRCLGWVGSLPGAAAEDIDLLPALVGTAEGRRCVDELRGRALHATNDRPAVAAAVALGLGRD